MKSSSALFRSFNVKKEKKTEKFLEKIIFATF